MFCSIITGGVTEGVSLPIEECQVPEGLDGPGQRTSSQQAEADQ